MSKTLEWAEVVKPSRKHRQGSLLVVYCVHTSRSKLINRIQEMLVSNGVNIYLGNLCESRYQLLIKTFSNWIERSSCFSPGKSVVQKISHKKEDPAPWCLDENQLGEHHISLPHSLVGYISRRVVMVLNTFQHQYRYNWFRTAYKSQCQTRNSWRWKLLWQMMKLRKSSMHQQDTNQPDLMKYYARFCTFIPERFLGYLKSSPIKEH